MCQVLRPTVTVWPRPTSWSRRARPTPSTASFEPGVYQRPCVRRTSACTARAWDGAPRTVTFVSPPPCLGRARMTTLSKTTSFRPPSLATIGNSLITRAVSRSTWLCSSASAPLRRTMTFRGLPDVSTTR